MKGIQRMLHGFLVFMVNAHSGWSFTLIPSSRSEIRIRRITPTPILEDDRILKTTGCLQRGTSLSMFFADEAVPSPTTDTEQDATSVSQSLVNVEAKEGNEETISRLARFMIDSFWLSSPQLLVVGGEASAVTDPSGLVNAQAQDLMDKYGERMGKRLLESTLIEATERDTGETLGTVGIEVCLLDKVREEMLTADRSEDILTTAVASLGPKQRRQYKNSSAREIAAELLPPEVSAVVSLSNLAVSPSARRRGVARQLCDVAEKIANTEWGFPDLYLKVEEDNMAAKTLYENKLGYKVAHRLHNQRGLRVDAASQSFSETSVNMIIMSKAISS